jgi:hypothetical protein
MVGREERYYLQLDCSMQEHILGGRLDEFRVSIANGR